MRRLRRVGQVAELCLDGGAAGVRGSRELPDGGPRLSGREAFGVHHHRVEPRVEAAQRSIWVTGCQSWYLDDRGIPATWPWTFDRFREVMAAPDPSAFEYR